MFRTRFASTFMPLYEQAAQALWDELHETRRSPRVTCEVTEDKAIVFRAELPGVAPENLEIKVHNTGLITVSDIAEKPIYRQDTWQVPEDCDLEAVVAHLEQGVLTVTVPRKADATSEHIVPLT